MTMQRDLDTILAAWLDEGPTDLPDATRRAIVTALPATTQARRGRLALWRLFEMIGFGRLAATAVVAAIAIGGLVYVVYPRPAPGSPSPTPGVSSTPSPSATAAPTLELVTFTSSQFRYSISVPILWNAVPATEPWATEPIVEPDTAYVDTFHPRGTVLGASVAIAAQALPPATGAAQWLADYARTRETSGGPCFGPASAWTDSTVAGMPARRIDAPCDVALAAQAAFVEYAFVVDGTGYVITGTPTIVELMVATFVAP